MKKKDTTTKQKNIDLIITLNTFFKLNCPVGNIKQKLQYLISPDMYTHIMKVSVIH